VGSLGAEVLSGGEKRFTLVEVTPATRARRLPVCGPPIPWSCDGQGGLKMKMKIMAFVPAVLAAAVVLIAAPAWAAGGNTGFGFNAAGISGFPTGAATLTGGGAYNPGTGFAKSAGGFRCTSDVGQGPLAGCLAGQGVRWDTVELRTSTTFKCTGSAAELLKTAITDQNTVVLLADFYRAGDGNDESFTAQMIVSADDIAPDIAGTQNVWIQGVGCAPAIANFSS
jgi:hypothetical protein